MMYDSQILVEFSVAQTSTKNANKGELQLSECLYYSYLNDLDRITSANYQPTDMVFT